MNDDVIKVLKTAYSVLDDCYNSLSDCDLSNNPAKEKAQIEIDRIASEVDWLMEEIESE